MPVASSPVIAHARPDSYAEVTRRSERNAWRVDDVLPPGSALDLGCSFLPRLLLRPDELTFLAASEQRALNQIGGHAYVNLFCFVEEYIVADVLGHATAAVFGDDARLRALLRFAEEEVKHQELFSRFRTLFCDLFPAVCPVVAGAAGVAAFVRSHHPLAVMLTTYHLELATQHHYVASIQAAQHEERLDPLFVSLLKHHWLEERQHAQIDALEIEAMGARLSDAEMSGVVDDYLKIVGAMDALLLEQAELDAVSLAAMVAAPLSDGRRAAVTRAQHAAYRDMFLFCGMQHRRFVHGLSRLSPAAADRVAAAAVELKCSR